MDRKDRDPLVRKYDRPLNLEKYRSSRNPPAPTHAAKIRDLIRQDKFEEFKTFMDEKKPSLDVEDRMTCSIDAQGPSKRKFSDVLLDFGDDEAKSTFLIEAINRGSAKEEYRLIALNLLEKFPHLASGIKSGTRSPLHAAARAGQGDLIEAIRDTLQWRDPQLLDSALEMAIPDEGTPLDCALSLHKVEAVEALVKIHGERKLPPDSSVLEKPIKKKEIDTLTIVLNTFPAILTLNSFDHIIKTQNIEIWKIAVARHSDILANSGILHLAVKAQAIEIVKDILKIHPDLVEKRDKEGSYALEYNKASSNAKESVEIQESIRKILLEEILRRFNSVEIKKLFLKAESKDTLPKTLSAQLLIHA